jgi:hypothetical protein
VELPELKKLGMVVATPLKLPTGILPAVARLRTYSPRAVKGRIGRPEVKSAPNGLLPTTSNSSTDVGHGSKSCTWMIKVNESSRYDGVVLAPRWHGHPDKSADRNAGIELLFVHSR